MQKCLGVPHKRMVAEKLMAVLEMIFWRDLQVGSIGMVKIDSIVVCCDSFLGGKGVSIQSRICIFAFFLQLGCWNTNSFAL